MEKKVYYRREGEHSRGRDMRDESTVDMTIGGHVRRGEWGEPEG